MITAIVVLLILIFSALVGIARGLSVMNDNLIGLIRLTRENHAENFVQDRGIKSILTETMEDQKKLVRVKGLKA